MEYAIKFQGNNNYHMFYNFRPDHYCVLARHPDTIKGNYNIYYKSECVSCFIKLIELHFYNVMKRSK